MGLIPSRDDLDSLGFSCSGYFDRCPGMRPDDGDVGWARAGSHERTIPVVNCGRRRANVETVRRLPAAGPGAGDRRPSAARWRPWRHDPQTQATGIATTHPARQASKSRCRRRRPLTSSRYEPRTGRQGPIQQPTRRSWRCVGIRTVGTAVFGNGMCTSSR